MKSALKVALSMLSVLAMTLIGHVANAQPFVQPFLQQRTPPGHFSPAKSVQAYNLILSLDRNWHSGSSIPIPSVSLTNLGPDTLAFSLDSNPGDGFTIEYQVEYKNDATSGTDWKKIQSNVPPHLIENTPGQRPKSSTFSVLVNLHPGEQYHNFYSIVGYPMTDKGLYRITAYATTPNAIEVAGPDSAPTFVKKFDLKAHSNSVVFRRTSSGFADIDASVGKQIDPK